MKFPLVLLFCCLQMASLMAQKYTISGQIQDANSGEDLISATVYAPQANAGVVSNVYGFYSLSLPAGEYEIQVNYTGYTEKRILLNLQADTSINFSLSNEEGITLDSAVVVTDVRGDANVNNTQMGTIDLPMEQIKKLPVLMGEVDILKTIQLLPGVLAAGEGNTGFYVRGGGVDQNLLLLDEAVVYNAGHLLGFFSVFNGDAIKNTTLIKGGMPANYGGRLSSVIDIQMKDGNKQKFGAEGGIGLVASRLTFEGPIIKNKGSFLVSGRRTYLFDLAQPFLKGSPFEGTNYYFYDLNLKANYRLSPRDRIYLSGYFGRDVLNLNNPARDLEFGLNWGNATSTVRWNHLFGDKLFMNASFIFNDYDFSSKGRQDQFSFSLNSGIRDWGGKLSFDYYPNPKHRIKFGGDYTHHQFTPNIAEAVSGEQAFDIAPPIKYAQEAGLYILDDWKISNRLSLNAGLRFSIFQQLGPYTSSLDSTVYGRFEPVKTFYGPEPRISSKYSLTKRSSIKAGINIGRQYVHLVSNSATTLPTDLWLPSGELVQPQWGIQYALGYFQNFKENTYEFSVEAYYKDLRQQLDYAENYTPTIDQVVEEQFISGKGQAYGLELFLRKQKGDFTGWIAYTLARSTRNFEGILGNQYPSRFDRLHDLSIVGSYDYKRWNFGASFIFGSGSPYTPIKSIYIIGSDPVLEYGLRNSARLPAYHRLDLSASFRLNKKKEKRFSSTLVFSIYNVYNRKNVFFTYTLPEENEDSGNLELKSYKVSLFPIIPSISWNFKWRQK
ncbi:outer membrane receptor protein [Saprospira grandis DSM 2844]|uniref:Outer membrane receptor protein n=1 Tax=Saprospira grandis DSM 2844 TaxID=694433 RepID=J1I0V8_9BACT|nr:TonB-dependent receptor [Saprospira grandis]EJF51903.1 outer membrane receptor protein [Saprospira grandis DSM 2844]